MTAWLRRKVDAYIDARIDAKRPALNLDELLTKIDTSLEEHGKRHAQVRRGRSPF